MSSSDHICASVIVLILIWNVVDRIATSYERAHGVKKTEEEE